MKMRIGDVFDDRYTITDTECLIHPAFPYAFPPGPVLFPILARHISCVPATLTSRSILALSMIWPSLDLSRDISLYSRQVICIIAAVPVVRILLVVCMQVCFIGSSLAVCTPPPLCRCLCFSLSPIRI